jgi:cytosine/adenosine deaminase-related metal-dependent hydrolase
LVIKNGHVAEVKPIANKDSNSIDTPPVHYPYSTNVDCRNGLVLPSLCHPHVHLDKPYLLGTKMHPAIVKGDFNEALKLVTSAKKEYTYNDLVERGRRLILESVEAGVTCMRAHVEVDPTVGRMCLEAGLALKKEFGDEGKGLCDIQLAGSVRSNRYQDV